MDVTGRYLILFGLIPDLGIGLVRRQCQKSRCVPILPRLSESAEVRLLFLIEFLVALACSTRRSACPVKTEQGRFALRVGQ